MNPLALKLGAYGLILGACWLHCCSYGQREAQQESAQYRASVEAAGKQAQKDADIKAAKDKENAHASDLSYAKALSVLGADIERLRRARSSTNGLSAPAPSPTCPEGQRCFDREQFDSALRDFEGEVLTLVGEGATLKLRMDEAISWASRLNQ